MARTLTRRTAIGASLGAFAPAASLAAGQPDAALLALERDFDGAWLAELAAQDGSPDASDEAYEVTNSIITKMERIPARTLVGLKIKAKTVLRHHPSMPPILSEYRSADIKLAEATLRELLIILDG